MWPFISLLILVVTECSVVQIDRSFSDVLDTDATIALLAESSFPFAHEGPVWIEETDQVFFASNRLVDPSTNQQRINISRIDLHTNEVVEVQAVPELLMTNGGTLYSKEEILFCSQGYNNTPGALVVYNTRKMTSRKLELRPSLDLNSPNYVIFSDIYDGYFFTDPPYGYPQGFRPAPTLAPNVYFVNRKSLVVTPIITFPVDSKPNGVVLSLDGTILYVSDTGFATGNGNIKNPNIPRAIYAFTVTKGAYNVPVATDKRFFVENVDNGVADGIKLDAKGNLYAGVGDGVNIYSSNGLYLGKIAVPGGVSNFVFADTKLIMMAETAIYSVKLKVAGAQLAVPVPNAYRRYG